MTILKKVDLAGLLKAVAVLACLGAAGQVQAQARYIYSSTGAEVTDVQSGLMWRRCSEGQSWSAGVCSGTVKGFTHEQALAYAKTQSGWRLPNVKELSSLVDTTRFEPAIDGNAFPLTPNAVYWTSSPDVRIPSLAWSVDFVVGSVSTSSRYSPGILVRLVR